MLHGSRKARTGRGSKRKERPKLRVLSISYFNSQCGVGIRCASRNRIPENHPGLDFMAFVALWLHRQYTKSRHMMLDTVFDSCSFISLPLLSLIVSVCHNWQFSFSLSHTKSLVITFPIRCAFSPSLYLACDLLGGTFQSLPRLFIVRFFAPLFFTTT